MRVIFLGTAGSVPTPRRNLPAILLQREGEQLMFDCGEGVQRQMIIAKCGFHKNMRVFITHMHGDHVLGLPGLLQTMALLNRERKLHIYGPAGIRRFLEDIKEAVQFVLTFPVEAHEIIESGTLCDEEEYTVEAAQSDHVIPSFAYAFIEKPRPGIFHPEKAQALGVQKGPLWSSLQRGHKIKLSRGRVVKPEEVMDHPRLGRKIVYTGDTRPFKGLARLAENANLLIHEATLDDDLAERAREDGHSTPTEAAQEARKAMAKQLVLTHISARYTDSRVLLRQAKKTFKNTVVAKDFMQIEIPLPSE
jgi:ribonuclease Z